MAYLVLVRHGLSEYNKKGLWTGWDNPPLTSEGLEEAEKAGDALSDINFNYAFKSPLLRVEQTLDKILEVKNQKDIPVVTDEAINERNYGDYTGKNKWEIKEEIGDEAFARIRRGWDEKIPNGETLKDVYDREIPYFEENVFPKLRDGKNIIFVSSGNALRAIVKYLEKIPEDKVSEIEIGTGEVWVYNIDSNGNVSEKEIRSVNENKAKI